MENDLNSYFGCILWCMLPYIILSYSVLIIYVNSSSLISAAIFTGGFSSSDVEKKCLHIFLMFFLSVSRSSWC